jgi:hypothetical protein
MIAALLALLALGSARAQVPVSDGAGADSSRVDPAYDRLFGDSPEATAPAEEPGLPLWMFPAALGFVGLWAGTRLRPPQDGDAPSAMTVVSRTALGDRSHLIVVDVTGADGERRRLLVGTGTGAPSLVADLGAVAPSVPLLTVGSGPGRETPPQSGRGTFLDALNAIGAEADRRAESRLDPADIRGSDGAVPVAAPEEPRGRLRGVAAFAAHAEPRRKGRDDAAAHARSLVDEVLAERGADGPGPHGAA